MKTIVKKITKGYTKSKIDPYKEFMKMKEVKKNLTIEYIKEYGIWPKNETDFLNPLNS